MRRVSSARTSSRALLHFGHDVEAVEDGTFKFRGLVYEDRVWTCRSPDHTCAVHLSEYE
jgi:hypothetical protein